MNLEKNIAIYIQENKINLFLTAHLLGLSPSDLKAILRGKRKMKADELIIFCQYYGLDLSFFKTCRSY